MNPQTKLRELPMPQRQALVSILEEREGWKRLAGIIPKQIPDDRFDCEISDTNPPAIKSHYISEFENESLRSGLPSSEILLYEWDTLGRVRPTLGHLLHLLTSARLIRAADYVSQQLLQGQPVKRPDTGPLSKVDVGVLKSKQDVEFEKFLHQMNVPTSLVNELSVNGNSVSRNVNLDESTAAMDDKYVKRGLSDMLEKIDIVSDMIKFSKTESSGLENNDNNSRDTNVGDSVSNMIEFSKSESCNLQESQKSSSYYTSSESESKVQSFLSKLSNSLDPNEMVALSKLLNSTSNNLPHFSLLNAQSSSHATSSHQPTIPTITVQEPEGSCEVPDEHLLSQILSKLNDSAKNDQTSSSDDALESHLLSQILNKLNEHQPVTELTETSSTIEDSESHLLSQILLKLNDVSTSQPSSRSTCASPLPNVPLMTFLPHISYENIAFSTNSFDERPYNALEASGNLLGKGGFGSVYLANNLLGDKPVAVKKLFLKGPAEEVTLDDEVTVMFKNEVDVLSTFRHENLVSLLGYSCDGETYCLVYEYVPCGALSDRLLENDKEKQLLWKDRLNIALGTAKAVTYLHTAESTPMIHRDIKSANILLDEKKKPKLCDFGIVKMLPSNVTKDFATSTGTAAYMAPEAFAGEVSIKLDTFSFGIVLLELITGLTPFDKDRECCDILSHVQEMCEDSIAPLVDLHGAGPWRDSDINYAEELYKIAVRCVEQRRRERPTMVEVKDQLCKLADNLTVKM